jgi:hypothetical protein
MQWQLEGESPAGSWTVLNSGPESAALEKMDLRKAAIQELERNGIRYILVADGEFAAPDFRANMPLWGIRLLADTGNNRLYQAE